jgi:Tol biopolymer transport system component/DNA-binding winged helix-turn-helix (wHTH) protein
VAREAGHVPNPSKFLIQGIEVRVDLNRLVTDRGDVTLEPKIMSVLSLLAERPGEVVTKEEILREVWNGTFVGEDVLTRAIRELRRAFGDDAAEPRVIETIRKRGYRLIAPVQPVSSVEAAAPEPAEAGAVRPSGPAAAAALGAAAAVVVLGAAALLGVHLWRAAESNRAPAGGMRVVPFTNLAGNERDPSVSPDGTRVAFAWNGGTGDEFRIYVRLRDSERLVRLTSGPGADRVPVWSPDGQSVAFSRFRGEGCDLMVVAALGGRQREIAPCPDPDHARFAWSPDGRVLAVSGRPASGKPDRLELLPLGGGPALAVTAPPAESRGDFDPAFSPDGRSVAFVRALAGSVADVFVAPVAGGRAVRRTFDNADLEGITWSPDGESIVFSSNRGGIYSLWTVGAAGGSPRFLAGGGTKIKHPSASRAGSVIAYESWIYDVNLWAIPASGAGAAARPLTSTTDEWNYAPAFSPDGSRIAFVSTRSGQPEIWVMGRGGDGAFRAASLAGAQVGPPAWSPDGHRLVFSGRPEGQADLYVADVSGGPLRRLTADPGDEVAPSWSRDGRWIYFSSRRTGDWEIWRIPAGGGEESRVTSGGGIGGREGPDGRTLYFSRAEVAGLFRMPVGGGAAERVLGHPGAGARSGWELTPGGLFTQDDWTDDGACIRFRPHGESDYAFQAILSGMAWPGFAVSPDGRTIVYPRSDRRTSDIRLIENAF